MPEIPQGESRNVVLTRDLELTCSITSGAIQHGVPTNVFRTLFRVMSPPVARKALTPKSARRKVKMRMMKREKTTTGIVKNIDKTTNQAVYHSEHNKPYSSDKHKQDFGQFLYRPQLRHPQGALTNNKYRLTCGIQAILSFVFFQ